MLEKREKKTENEEYLKKVYPLQNLGKKFQRIQVSGNHEQVVRLQFVLLCSSFTNHVNLLCGNYQLLFLNTYS